MSLPIIIICVVGFIITNVSSALLFKYASATHGMTAIWYFIAGNFAGFFCPICLVFALKGTNPNVIYAICLGGAFCFIQIGSWILFHQPLSTWQWSGVLLVGAGVLLLQIR